MLPAVAGFYHEKSVFPDLTDVLVFSVRRRRRGRKGDDAIVAPNLRCRGTSQDNGGVVTFIHGCYCLLTLSLFLTFCVEPALLSGMAGLPADCTAIFAVLTFSTFVFRVGVFPFSFLILPFALLAILSFATFVLTFSLLLDESNLHKITACGATRIRGRWLPHLLGLQV